MCPICGNKMRNRKHVVSLHYINGRDGEYTERLCNGVNHTIQIFVSEKENTVDFVRISLDPKYSKLIEIDYYNQKCSISCMKNGVADVIKIDKMIEPDFPDLEKLKEKVSLYVTFS